MNLQKGNSMVQMAVRAPVRCFFLFLYFSLTQHVVRKHLSRRLFFGDPPNDGRPALGQEIPNCQHLVLEGSTA